MRNLLILIVTLLLSSCTSYITTYKGDITTYKNNGEILDSYEQIIVKQYISNSAGSIYKVMDVSTLQGLDFYNPKTDSFVFVNNLVPYKINYKLDSRVKVSKSKTKSELIKEYDKVSKEYKKLKESIKNNSTDSELITKYNLLKDKKIKLEQQITAAF